MNASCGTGKPGKSDGKAAGTGSGLNDRSSGTDTEFHADEADILGVKNLGLPLYSLDEVVQRGTHQAVGDPLRSKDFGTVGGGCDVGHQQDAVLSMHILFFFHATQAALAARRDNNDEFSKSRHERSLIDEKVVRKPCG